jgi:cephalosporin hydroxylase
MDKAVSFPLESATPESAVISRPPAFAPRWSLRGLACLPVHAYNTLHRLVRPAKAVFSNSVELCQIRQLAAAPSDIDEHLEQMFTETLLCRPGLIVELGVRGGVSTFVFERAAALFSSTLVGVDIADCSGASRYPRWHFHRGDDVQFAAEFADFCGNRHLTPQIDLLFIDTSHYYDHSVQEIGAWFPHLSLRAKVMFHDTNMKLTGPRRDGRIQLAWDNQRGVIRAIEELLDVRIDESRECVEHAQGWLLRHFPHCNGLTILDRVLT